MKEKIKNTLTDKKFYIFLMITLIFFGIFQKLEYATDTYCVFVTSTKKYCQHFINCGRFISALCLAITKVLKFNPTQIYTISYLLAILVTTVSMYVLYNILAKDVKSKLTAFIIAIMIIINLFSIELYLFLEKGIMMLSVLFCVLAFKHFVKYLEGNKKELTATLLYMTLANFSYQGTVGLFIALSAIYIIKQSRTFKQFIKYNIVAALCYGIPAAIDYAIVKYAFKNSRVSNEVNIVESAKLIWKNTKEMFIQTFKIIPNYCFAITLGIIILTVIILVINNKSELKKKFLLLLEISYLILAVYIVTIFPQIMQSTASIGFAPRNTYTFASIIGILMAFICIEFEQKKFINYYIVVISTIFLIIQYTGFLNIERNRYIINYNDWYNAMQIKEKVERYENESGNKITKVAIYGLETKQASYPELFTSGDINIKAIDASWSRMDHLKYYLERDLEEIDPKEEIYDKYYKNKNWKIFDIDQIVLIDDVLHMYTF